MQISDVTNRDEVLSTIIKELDGFGIKIRNEKRKKQNNRKLFGGNLQLMELNSVILSNGSVVQIPEFVSSACSMIQMELETEGLFRKTGSLHKQKVIQEQLQKGAPLQKGHHVIDVTNLLKTFFRSLPESLIPLGPIQESLLRCLFLFSSYEEKCEAILMIILLLPPITVSTLAFFLQFLQVVIKHSSKNLMTVDNLVKVLTPTLMPVPTNAPQKRLDSHFKVMELLIENANLVGVVPDRICKKENFVTYEPKKKNRRRSGSMNRVFTGLHNVAHNGFNGLRKIVGAMSTSSESLDRSDVLQDPSAITPSITKSSKKRPLDKLELSTFSSKKKKDLLITLASLTEQDDPNSPSTMKNADKKRKSLGANLEKSSPNKRRWSFGRSTTSKTVAASQDTSDGSHKEISQREEDYVKIPKREYEAFKDRLVSIETKITHEFHKTKLSSLKAEIGQNDSMHLLNGPEKVENKFNQTLQEVEKLEDNERKTEQLAKRLSRDLKIRPNMELMRSPSARKIGSLRRRRDSATRLSRNQSWHLGQISPGPLKKPQDDVSSFISSASFYPKSNLKRAKPVQATTVQQTSRPLPEMPSSAEKPVKFVPEKPIRVKRESTDQFVTPIKVSSKAPEVWTPAVEFFNDISMDVQSKTTDDHFFKTPVRPKLLSTSKSVNKNDNDLSKTPMLPPRSTPAKIFHTPTLSTPFRSMDFTAINKSLMLTPSMNDASHGRESIIILRNKNAGMVAQKAKLFDGMSEPDASNKFPRVIVNKNLESVKCMSFNETPRKNRENVPSRPRSPRRSPRSPGVQKRYQFKSTPQQSPLKTIRECSGHQKAKLLKPEILSEIASPKTKTSNRQLLSQSNNTPKRKTPNRESAKKRRPSKSPRFVRRVQTSD